MSAELRPRGAMNPLDMPSCEVQAGRQERAGQRRAHELSTVPLTRRITLTGTECGQPLGVH